MKTSKIGWTDYSGGDLNFVTGCTPVSEGCHNCYARAIYKRFKRDFSKVTMHPEKLRRLARKRFPQYSPKRHEPCRSMCFVCDTGDLFHDHVSSDFIDEALCMMHRRDDVVWQILTKRPQRMRACIEAWSMLHDTYPHEYIWLGISVESPDYLWRVEELLKIDAAVRFVSVEPMLEGIDLRAIYQEIDSTTYCLDALSGDATWFEMRDTGACELMGEPGPAISWVIVGAESGPNRRPFDVAWAADIKRQCDAAGVAFFGKQDSGLRPGVPLLIDGQEWKAWPK